LRIQTEFPWLRTGSSNMILKNTVMNIVDRYEEVNFLNSWEIVSVWMRILLREVSWLVVRPKNVVEVGFPPAASVSPAMITSTLKSTWTAHWRIVDRHTRMAELQFRTITRNAIIKTVLSNGGESSGTVC
jgi:hypothetical protein